VPPFRRCVTEADSRAGRLQRLSDAAGRNVSRETFEKLDLYVAMLRAESAAQNLVSAATLDHAWDRHIVDSAQLVRFERGSAASWLDIGSGAGLPGIVIACLVGGHVTLLEPRRLRAEFLHKANESLGLGATVLCTKVERARGSFDMITARAVAPLSQLLKISAHLSTGKTVWALPKGRSAEGELAEARRSWQGVFDLEPSVTDHDSYIVVGTGVRAK
jgi:16S rRNA (guanine527-N7)-methyltransferase